MPAGTIIVVVLLLVLGLVLGSKEVRERIDVGIRSIIIWVIVAACVLWFLNAVGVL